MYKYTSFRFLVYWAFAIAVVSFWGACDKKSSYQWGSNDDSPLINTAYAQTDSHQTNGNTGVLFSSRQNAITRAVEKVSPAVVGINVTQVQRYIQRNPLSFWFPERYRDRIFEREVKSLGSGFIISHDGYIVTNQHVVEDASEIVVTMSDGSRLKATLEGSDALTDIALVKIDGANFPFIKFGRSDDLIVGEWVIALGNPFGLVEINGQPTVTVGVISAIDRDWGRTNGRLYQDMIQTDAAINHGNSGGPLVNSLGQVIGMNTFIFTGSKYEEGSVGIGFAIPIERIDNIIGQIRREGGINRKIWHGIFDVETLTPRIVRALRLTVKTGVIVTDLDRRGPGYKAGLREYDIITGAEGETITNRRDFIKTLDDLDLKVGSKLTFNVVRDNTAFKITIILEEMPDMRR